MQIINASYEILRDPIQRKVHDEWIKRKLAEIEAKPSQTQTTYTATTPPRPNPPTVPQQPQASNTPKKDNSGCGCLIIIAISILLLWTCSTSNKPRSSTTYTPSSYTTSTPRPLKQTPTPAPFDKPIQPLPPSGRAIAKANFELIAPFEIKSSTGANYLVKLVDTSTGDDVLTTFVRGGETVDINAPLGTYYVKYASGKNWYGDDYLFGPDTQCAKTKETFTFSREIDAQSERQLILLNRELAISDSDFKSFLISKGLGQKMASYMFDQMNPTTKEKGLDRLTSEWWKNTFLSKIKNASLYNAIVDRLNARSRIYNAREELRARAEKITGYTITLYKVINGNLETQAIDRSDF